MKNAIILILIVILAALGGYLYSRERNLAKDGEQATHDPAPALSASFVCKDTSHFIAEFPTGSEEVKIVIDGTAVRTLPRVAGDGQRFENSTFAYVFAGEEVTVTDKVSKKTTTCAQPADPNNAPVNFGDSAEGGAGFAGSVQPDVAALVTASAIGKWKSVDDAKFIREFKSGGVAIDSYNGKADATGTWKVFTKANAPAVTYTLENDAIYLQMSAGSAPADTLTFKVVKVTPEELELIYLERGNTLKFTKVQ
jgi:hypothetical protein